MGGIVLRILLDGLIALVPAADNSSFLTALVVDGTHPPIEASTCVAPHMATLQFTFAGDQALACTNLGCKVSGSTCTCTFDRNNQYQVSFVAADVVPFGGHLKQRPDLPMPRMQQQAADPAYLVDLQPLGQLDTTFLTTKAAAGLLGRMELPYTNLTACNLARIKDGGDYFAHTFNVRKFGTKFDQTKPLQALAQALIAEADIPSGSAKLALAHLGGGGTHEFDLAPENCGDQMCLQVFLSNHRDPLQEGNPCVTVGVGFDFAFYYQLTENAPTWTDRPVPVMDSVTQLESNLALPACKIFDAHEQLKAATSRPVCAMAFFN